MVDVEKTQDVHCLKKLIRAEKPQTFTNVEVDALNLYQVTIEENLEKKPHMEELERLYKEKESEVLDEGKPLWKYFVKSLPPPGMEYYIMVEIPKGESSSHRPYGPADVSLHHTHPPNNCNDHLSLPPIMVLHDTDVSPPLTLRVIVPSNHPLYPHQQWT